MNNTGQWIEKAARYSRKLNRILSVSALAVVLGTAYILMKPAHTAEGSFICGIAEHTHTESCYEILIDEETGLTSENLICTIPEHIHTVECFDVKPLPSPSDETYEHVHTEECYRGGELICTLVETKREPEPVFVSEREGSESDPYRIEDYADGVTVEIPDEVRALLEDGHLFENSDSFPFTMTIHNQYPFIGGTYFAYPLPYEIFASDGAPVMLQTEFQPLLADGIPIGEWRIANHVILCRFDEVSDTISPVSLTLPVSLSDPAAKEEMIKIPLRPVKKLLGVLHDGTEDSPYTVSDYGGTVVAACLDGAEERLLSEDPFEGSSSFSFRLQIDNSDTYVPGSWFEYVIPFDFAAHPKAYLRCTSDDNRIIAKGVHIGEWELTKTSIRCHFNDTAGSCNLVHMLFTLTLDSGEDLGREFDLEHPFVCVRKLDAYTEKPLAGVTFGLFSKDGTELAREVTDANGLAIFSVTYADANLDFYEPYYLKEIYDSQSPAYLSEYAKDETERWFVSTGDTIPPLRQGEVNAILAQHPDIVRITQSDRERYAEGTKAFEVLNYPYYSLPETGGMGMFGLYLLGAAALITAFFVSKRRNKGVPPPPRFYHGR